MPDLYRDEERVRSAIEKQRGHVRPDVDNWQSHLKENLIKLNQIVNWQYEYLIKKGDPSGENLASILDTLLFARTVIQEDVINQEKELTSGTIPVPHSKRWKSFIKESKELIHEPFLDVLDEINVYQALIKAKEEIDDSQGRRRRLLSATKKDSIAMREQHRALIDKLHVFANRFANVVKQLP